MSKARATFDLQRFTADVNATRQVRGMTWRQVALESGTSPSTFTRMNSGQDRKPDVNNLTAIAVWAGLSLDDYVLGRYEVLRQTQAMITGLVLSDPSLSKDEQRALAQVIKIWYTRAAVSEDELSMDRAPLSILEPQRSEQPELESDDENLAEHTARTQARYPTPPGWD